jgi:hypothetical protein
MKLLGWFAIGLLVGLFSRAALAIETKHDKDVRECSQRADAHLSTAKLKHPADVNKVKLAEINKCMAGRGYAVGKIREK